MQEILTHGAALSAGVLAGWWSYRYWLKRNPELVERLARELREKLGRPQ